MLMLSRKKNFNTQSEVIVLNEAIYRVSKAKLLGLIVDHHLNWKDPHIDGVKKVCKSCGIISLIEKYF